MNRYALVVAPWGMPYIWKLVVYEINRFRCKSCTSFLPLLTWLRSEEFKDVEIHPVVIVLDSVIDWRKQNLQTQNPCRICFERFGDILVKTANVSTYDMLKQLVAEFTKKFIYCVADETRCNFGGEEKNCSEVLEDVLKNIHIIVAPAIGKPGGTWSFIGRIQDYEIAVLRDISAKLMSNPYNVIIADLTHGINFMPSITTRIISRIASILLLAHREVSSVEVKLYNSDPIPTTATENTVISINEAVYTSVKSIEVVHNIANKFVYASSKEYSFIEAELGKSIGGVLGKTLSTLRYMYSALYYPLPLALHTFLCTMYKDLEVVEHIEEVVVNKIIVDHVKHGIIRPLTMDSDIYYIYLLLKALRQRLSTTCREPELSIDTLRLELAPIYKYIHTSYENLIEHELSQVKLIVDKVLQKPEYQSLQGLYRTLAELEVSEDRRETKEKKRMDKRIMIAHAGLQKEFVAVEISSKPKLKYIISVEELMKELKEAGLLIETTTVKKSC
jgi:CRISPR-associated protein Csx1